MSDFLKKTWVNGEVIYADDLNRMEDGIAEANKNAASGQVHSHGNISYGGGIGTVAGKIITTGEGGKLVASTPEEAREKLGMGDSLQDIQTNAQNIQKLESRLTYGTTDLTAGESALETGKVYLVYE